MRKTNPFAHFFAAQGFVMLDGGLATRLEATGHRLDTALWSARLLLDAPEAIREAHLAYLQAGADCITTSSYQASFEGFAAAGIGERAAEGLLRGSVELACEARDAFWAEHAHHRGRLEPIVAASAGPYGAYLANGSEYDGRYGVGRETLAEFHRRRLHVLCDTSADLIAFETIPSLTETEVIAALLGELPRTWAWISFTCRDAERLRDGSRITDAVSAALAAPRLAGVGVNCTAPHHVAALVETVRSVTDLPVIAYPNSGEVYDPASRRWGGHAESAAWLERVQDAFAAGARVLGGCCRIGPPTISELRARLSIPGRHP
jgi:homocysteine S-methyltransferase